MQHREMLRLFREYGSASVFQPASPWASSDDHIVEGSIPEVHPSRDHNTLTVMRFLRVLKDEGDAGLLESCSRRLYESFFAAHIKPSDAAFLQSLCSQRPALLSQDRLDDLMQWSVDPANKKRLADEAEELVKAHGAFGMPWIVVQRADGETASWFGSDRFGNIAWW